MGRCFYLVDACWYGGRRRPSLRLACPVDVDQVLGPMPVCLVDA